MSMTTTANRDQGSGRTAAGYSRVFSRARFLAPNVSLSVCVRVCMSLSRASLRRLLQARRSGLTLKACFQGDEARLISPGDSL
jgi:hypothetical protein